MDEISARDAGTVKLRESELLRFYRQQVVEGDYSGRKLTSFSAGESSFERCRFERMRIKDACFGAGIATSVYADCSFDGSRIVATAPGRARFVRCSFRDVRLKNWFCNEAEFVDCVFSGKGEGLVFHAAPEAAFVGELGRSTNEFRGNDFSGMALHDVSFRGGIDLQAQALPGGDDYLFIPDALATVVRARAEVSLWDDDAARERALGFLRMTMEDIQDGQEQLFLRPADYMRHNPEAMRQLFALLTAAS